MGGSEVVFSRGGGVIFTHCSFETCLLAAVCARVGVSKVQATWFLSRRYRSSGEIDDGVFFFLGMGELAITRREVMGARSIHAEDGAGQWCRTSMSAKSAAIETELYSLHVIFL